jgi:hypothetical protein
MLSAEKEFRLCERTRVEVIEVVFVKMNLHTPPCENNQYHLSESVNPGCLFPTARFAPEPAKPALQKK